MKKANSITDTISALEKRIQDLTLPKNTAIRFVPVDDAPLSDLPPDIQKCAKRRCNSFAAGRRAARDALHAAGYSGHTDLAIGPDKLPIWPDGWLGNISHTDEIAAAIVVPALYGCLLGIDIEQTISSETAAEIASEVAPELLSQTANRPLEEVITRAFSAKEALYKALFPLCREFKDFSAARVLWRQDTQVSLPQMQLMLTETWHANHEKGSIYDVEQVIISNYVLSVVWIMPHQG